MSNVIESIEYTNSGDKSWEPCIWVHFPTTRKVTFRLGNTYKTHSLRVAWGKFTDINHQKSSSKINSTVVIIGDGQIVSQIDGHEPIQTLHAIIVLLHESGSVGLDRKELTTDSMESVKSLFSW